MRDSLIVEWADAGISAKKIVERLRDRGIKVADKTVRKVLINKGYEYVKSNHTWHKPNENNIRIEVNNKTDEPSNDNEIVSMNREVNAIQNLNSELSLDEFTVLKQMIFERMNSDNTDDDIYSQIAKLKTRERKNRTYYIGVNIIEDLSRIAERNGLKASQLIEVALLELFNKYDLK